MKIQFYKYQGTGNDFVILDNREGAYSDLTQQQVNFICHRRFGIGADGLMLLNKKDGYDFEMIYYNADGKPGSMCGNGGRCLVKFANDIGIKKTLYRFIATDGEHEAEIDEDDGIVSLKMQDVTNVDEERGDYILNTGSPHFVRIVNELEDLDVFEKGREIRYNNTYKEKGINVNFVSVKGDYEIDVRTYERGVEDETFSCGTGVTASALVCYHNDNGFNNVSVHTRGGDLTVEYDRIDDDSYTNIWLCGPAKKVFEGDLEIA
ncbi:MAG: diaminopimelate epimerase [Pedobacter sp.]|nr:MAG: diaminopimelate epimerase [Pedobacter sp.]